MDGYAQPGLCISGSKDKIMASNTNELSTCVNQFTLDIYKSVLKTAPEENAFMSASSALVVMAMVHMGARGNTLKQMTNVLKFNQLQEKRPEEHLAEFISLLNKGSQDFTLKTANRLYPHVNKMIMSEYIQAVSKYFGAETKSLDFTTQPDSARVEINDWVEGETNGKIKDLLAPGVITPLTAMVVVNAIYFKGDWAEKFDTKITRKQPFFLLDKSEVKVDMMTKMFQTVNFGISKSLDARILELPYKGKQLSMFVVLPEKKDGLSVLENKLSATDVEEIISGSMLHRDTVMVSMPKFKLETKYVLNDMLAALGMPDLFDETKANLSGMSKEEQLYVSLVVQKAFVDVNEEGTEASAATGVTTCQTVSSPPTQQFQADHPFLFMIVHKKLGVPLFMGRFVTPSSQSHDGDQNPLQQREDL